MTDYDPSLHAPARPKHMELPPLLKLVMERNRKQRLDKAGQTGQETDLLLPAYKVYDKDVRLTDTVEPNLSLADLIGIYIGQFLTWPFFILKCCYLLQTTSLPLTKSMTS